MEHSLSIIGKNSAALLKSVIGTSLLVANFITVKCDQINLIVKVAPVERLHEA